MGSLCPAVNEILKTGSLPSLKRSNLVKFSERKGHIIGLVTTELLLQRTLTVACWPKSWKTVGDEKKQTSDTLFPQLCPMLALTGWPSSDEFSAT